MTVVEKILAFIYHKNIKHIFVIPGAQIDPLLGALANIEQMIPIIPNHELAAGYMADGYARISDTMGVVFSIGSAGAVNLLAAAVNAKVENSPVIFVTGSVATSAYGSGCFQDTSAEGSNDMALFKEAVTSSFVCTHAHHIDTAIHHILEHSKHKKPLHIVLPLDVQQQETDTYAAICKDDNAVSYAHMQSVVNRKLSCNKRETLPCTYDIISLQTIMTALENTFNPNTIYCLDAGQVRYAGNIYMQNKASTFLLQSRKQAPMGWAICAAIGAKLAAPEQTVVALFGDGSMRMHGIELATAVRYNIPIIFVLCDNAAYGTLYHRYKHKNTEKLTMLDALDWERYVSSFGMHTFHVTDKNRLHDSIKEASELKQPCLIWLHIAKEDPVMQEVTL